MAGTAIVTGGRLGSGSLLPANWWTEGSTSCSRTSTATPQPRLQTGSGSRRRARNSTSSMRRPFALWSMRPTTGTDALDYVCNHRGIGAALPIEHVDLDHWQRTIDVNLSGVMHGCHAAYPHMVRQAVGRSVNTASLAGLLGGLGTAVPYTASKHAVVGLSLAWWVAAAPHDVGVHVVCPGGVDTRCSTSWPSPGWAFRQARRSRCGRSQPGWGSSTSTGGPPRQRCTARGRPRLCADSGPQHGAASVAALRMAPELMLRLSVTMMRRQSRKAGL
jgi:NAD(P)-dependent dehydrogenase (short-subunit alcohol dehydrogenase family)